MGISADKLNREAQFLRRAPLAAALASSAPRAGFAPYGEPQWANFRPGRAREISIASLRLRGSGGTLQIHDSDWARSLTASDRLMLDGVEYEIEIPPVASGGVLTMEIAEAPGRSMYGREMEQRGQLVSLRRVVADAAPIEVRARALVTGYEPNELVSGIQQGSRRVIMSAEDLEAQNFPVPPRSGDTIMLRTRKLRIDDVDESTHRDGNGLNAYLIRATGA